MDAVCPNQKYSTTQLFTTEPVAFSKLVDRQHKGQMLLRESAGGSNSGGLRTKGYSKHSYRRQNGQWHVCDEEGRPEKFVGVMPETNCDELPLITVITVVFNGKEFLENAILSVIEQTYPNVEYIIIDGGSVDGTLDLILKYEDEIDYWISEPDGGIYDAMNKGIQLAHGKWIYFLGADDILLDELNALAPNFKKDGIYYGNVKIKQTEKIWGERVTKYSMMQRNISHQAMFYPASVFSGSLFNLRYKLLADWEFNIQIYGKSWKQFHYINKTIATYNREGVSSVQADKFFEQDLFKIIRDNFGFKYYLLKIIRQFLASCYKKFAGTHAGIRA